MTPLTISDHAVLRYMERVLGCDVDGVRRHIADICSVPASIGASAVTAEGFRFHIVHHHAAVSVTTVTPVTGHVSRTSQRRLIREVA